MGSYWYEAREAYAELERTPNALDVLAADQLLSSWARLIAAVPENPNRWLLEQDRDFAIVVPVTGGLDSTTLWAMTQDASLPALPYYIDFGQPYAQTEVRQAARILHELGSGFGPEIITRIVQFKQFQHIMNGRNALAIFILADVIRDHNRWGEIWFGNVAGEGPIIGGDKSFRFFLTINQILVHQGRDVRVVSPLVGLLKADLVAWWLNRPDGLKILRMVKSCFHPELRACGRCQTCFRFFVALHANGISALDNRIWFDQEPDFSEHVAKYEPLCRHALENNDFTRYPRRRAQLKLAACAAWHAR